MFNNILPLEEVDNHKNPKITHHFINKKMGWEWWVCAGEKLVHTDDYYFFGVGKIIMKEMGCFTYSQIQEYGGELDTEWDKNIGLYDILE